MVTIKKYRCIYCNTEIDLTNKNINTVICPHCKRRQNRTVTQPYLMDYKFLVPWVITENDDQRKNS